MGALRADPEPDGRQRRAVATADPEAEGDHRLTVFDPPWLYLVYYRFDRSDHAVYVRRIRKSELLL